MKNKRAFHEGQKVVVFHDPLTQKDKEGNATTVSFRYTGGFYFEQRIEWWIVKFENGTKGLRKLVESRKVEA